MNWRDYSYLRTGDETQRRAFATLESLKICETLRDFDPALVSTVCLRLDISGSDLDIICEVESPEAFESVARSAYAKKKTSRCGHARPANRL